MPSNATIVGLAVALLGPALLFTPGRNPAGKPERLRTRVFELLFLWILAGAVTAIVLWWEKLPISSIGFQPGWRSVVLGLLLALFFNRVAAPLLYRMTAAMGCAGFETGLSKMMNMPAWFLLFAGLTAGVVEETLFRGYAIERLAAVTGSPWWAGLAATTVAALHHLPMWGWGPVATFFVSGGILSVFYILTRDLAACMMAHAITDIVGFVAARNAARGRGQSSYGES